jgi:hypothetical protein
MTINWPFARRNVSPQPLDTGQALIEEFEHLAPGKWALNKATPLIEAFKRIHDLPGDEQPTALCLSGGGIRSATFCLGVLQAFACSGRLKAFHYLSTVSGGGYIGSWLSNWRSQRGWDWQAVMEKLCVRLPPESASARAPGGTEEAERDPVSRLRAYSNYLSPVWGLSTDALSLVAIFVRNLLLNLLVWVPLLAGAVALPRLYVALVGIRPDDAYWPALGLTAAAASLVVVGIAYVVADLPGNQVKGAKHKGVLSHFALFCFAPITLAAIVLSVAGMWASHFHEIRVYWFLAGGVIAHLLGIVSGIVWRAQRELELRKGPRSIFGIAMVLLSGAAGGGLLWLALQYAGPTADAASDQLLLYSMLSVPLMLACFWLALTLYAGWVRRWTSEEDREWWARATAWWLYASLTWTTAFALVIYLPPWLFDQLGLRLPAGAQVGLGGAALGIVTSAIGYWSNNGADLKRRANGLLQATGLHLLDLMAALVIIAALLGLSLLVSWMLENCHAVWPYACAADLSAETSYMRNDAMLQAIAGAQSGPAPGVRSAAAQAYLHVMVRARWYVVAGGVAGLLGLALLTSWLIGANTFSLHGMYGNRLVRAYLGAGRRERNPNWFTGFDPNDNCRLTSVLPPVGDRLFQVVNIALNLVRPSSHHLAWQQRKASSFTASPLHCGADGVGYVPTNKYGAHDGMSLGRALTISGAAASPNMGYHSSTLGTFVMTLFNVRLGWWLPNPGKAWAAQWCLSEPTFGFWALLNEAFGRTTDDRASVYLSDGGHFENLGLYEMVRRRCHRIVVIDVTCDPEFTYADLQNAVRKIRIDFGIAIDLPPVLPGPSRETAYPRLVVGRIRYSVRDGSSPESDGFLYLVKPRLFCDEPPDISQYAVSSHRDGNSFPHQSTADQFFDETQFESYRMLGLWSADDAFPGSADDWPHEDFRGAPPQSPKATAEEERSTTASAAGLTGLTGAVHSFGTGAALATALTVGGTVGVVGTLTVAPGVVHLSSEDRELLQKGIKVNVELDTSQPSVREFADRAQTAIRELQVAAERWRQARCRRRSTSPVMAMTRPLRR